MNFDGFVEGRNVLATMRGYNFDLLLEVKIFLWISHARVLLMRSSADSLRVADCFYKYTKMLPDLFDYCVCFTAPRERIFFFFLSFCSTEVDWRLLQLIHWAFLVSSVLYMFVVWGAEKTSAERRCCVEGLHGRDGVGSVTAVADAELNNFQPISSSRCIESCWPLAFTLHLIFCRIFLCLSFSLSCPLCCPVADNFAFLRKG